MCQLLVQRANPTHVETAFRGSRPSGAVEALRFLLVVLLALVAYPSAEAADSLLQGKTLGYIVPKGGAPPQATEMER